MELSRLAVPFGERNNVESSRAFPPPQPDSG
jgi:hypothetical protein